MKKKNCFISLFFAVIMCAFFVCGCTPKTKTVWCDGIGGEKFQIEFSVANSNYNGDWASFSIKDETAFADYLKNHKDFTETIQMSDSNEEIYLFGHSGQNYFCRKTGNDGRYILSCAWFEDFADDACFAFPPVSFDSYRYDSAEEKKIPINKSWDYFVAYYAAIDGAASDYEEKTIRVNAYRKGKSATCGTVLLHYTENAFEYTIAFSGGEA